MKTPTKLILTAAAIATFGIGGLSKLVNATQTQSPVAVMPAAQVAVKSDGDGETNDDLKDQQEAKKLQSLAKITPQQAQQSAEAAERGKATSVKLENEDGNLVYAVAIGQKEVKVDAGNAHVLYTESVKGDRKDDKNDSNHPRSSIQVAQSADDGDGETNDDG
ncbi:PepSY domain-containing protein [Phormidesmis priestleyi]